MTTIRADVYQELQAALIRAGVEFSNRYEGVTVAGVAVVASDTGRVLLAQRAFDETDDEAVRETWEFPGGHLEEDEDPFVGASREFFEEIGCELAPGEVINGWRGGESSTDGHYQGFVYEIGFEDEQDAESFQPNEEVQAIGWFDSEDVTRLESEGKMRPEIVATMNWNLVFPETEDSMTDQTETEPDFDAQFLEFGAIPIHGVLAPEDTETGDARGFNAGSMTSRPMRLPFSYQKVSIGGHDGSVVVGSVDRLMRKDNMIHWEGRLMPSPETDEFVGVLAFFDRYGVSVDGDKGSLDMEKTEATGVMWFDAVRAAGLTAVSIPAFHEAYAQMGFHPEMPTEDALVASMAQAGDIVGKRVEFDRGPGWITNPKETKTIHDYWTKKGEPGYAKIGWGTPGDFTRAKALIGEKIAKNSPEKMKYLNQIIAQWHFDALGYYPGDWDKPGNDTTAEGRAKRKARLSAVPAFSIEALAEDDPIRGEAYCCHDGCSEPGEFTVSTDDAEWFAIFCGEHAPEHEDKPLSELFADEDIDFDEMDLDEVEDIEAVDDEESESKWEAVLVSSVSGNVARPNASYFDRHPDTGALAVDEPDEFGFRRVYGYAAERGVCHIGFSGRCVEPPIDETGEYAEFHLGRTKTSDGEFMRTGVLTYNVGHRDAERILTETPTQAHFDNLLNAWAAVRLGTDERGIWFSGVVLPKMDEDDLTLIQASGQVSGEWKYGALRSLLTVNTPGFPVMRASAEFDDEGHILSLAASAFTDTLTAAINEVADSPCAPTPAERMRAMKTIDAEIRFAALKAEFLSERGA